MSSLSPVTYTQAQPSSPDRVVLGDLAGKAAAWETTGDEVMRRRLSSFGPTWFVDMLSLGHLLEELALAVNVRPTVLRAWLRESVRPEDLIEAQQSAAAILRVKGLREIESTTPADHVDLGHLKLKADTYRQMAEAMDPSAWNPNPNKAPALGVANVQVNIMDPTALGGVQTNMTAQIPTVAAQVMMNTNEMLAQDQTQPNQPTVLNAPLETTPADNYANLTTDNPDLVDKLAQIGFHLALTPERSEG